MAKNTKIISLSVNPEHHALLRKKAREQDVYMSVLARQVFEDFVELKPDVERRLRQVAERRDCSVAKLVEQLVERFPIDDETVKPIILKIPVAVMTSRETLNKWLEDRCAALVSHLFPPSA